MIVTRSTYVHAYHVRGSRDRHVAGGVAARTSCATGFRTYVVLSRNYEHKMDGMYCFIFFTMFFFFSRVSVMAGGGRVHECIINNQFCVEANTLGTIIEGGDTIFCCC